MVLLSLTSESFFIIYELSSIPLKNKKKRYKSECHFVSLVGPAGFEPATKRL